MAFIDLVEWSPDSNAGVYAWRFPESNLSTATQLIVRESQEAVLFSKGQVLGKFGPGKHQLTTENLPILRRLYGIPFGGRNPFFAEVWFVNKAVPLTIEWKTTPMKVMDPDYGAMVPIAAQGKYGIKIDDAEKFLIKLNGTMTEFTEENLTSHFMGPLVAKTNSFIASYMSTNRVGITTIATQLDNISTFVKEPLAQFWDEYGILLTGIYITSIDVDTSTPEGKMISEALSERSAQNIAGYTWQQRRSFDVANTAVNNMNGGMGGIMGMAMMSGMIMNGGGSGGVGQSMLQQPAQQGYGAGPGFGPAQAVPNAEGGAPKKKQVFCSNCGKPYDVSSRFCPNCGDEYLPCPACGSDNRAGSRRCVTCGAQLPSDDLTVADVKCPRCGAMVKPGVRFCEQCGMRMES